MFFLPVDSGNLGRNQCTNKLSRIFRSDRSESNVRFDSCLPIKFLTFKKHRYRAFRPYLTAGPICTSLPDRFRGFEFQFDETKPYAVLTDYSQRQVIDISQWYQSIHAGQIDRVLHSPKELPFPRSRSNPLGSSLVQSCNRMVHASYSSSG